MIDFYVDGDCCWLAIGCCFVVVASRLQMASMTGHDECVELLVVDNEGINTQDSQGLSLI